MEKKNKNTLYIANDIVWLIAAVLCAFFDHPALAVVVALTTVVYAYDLFCKFRDMDWDVKMFLKKHWLDVLFLVPFIKIFRGFRVFKAGRAIAQALHSIDVASDASEVLFRLWNGAKKMRRSHGQPGNHQSLTSSVR